MTHEGALDLEESATPRYRRRMLPAPHTTTLTGAVVVRRRRSGDRRL